MCYSTWEHVEFFKPAATAVQPVLCSLPPFFTSFCSLDTKEGWKESAVYLRYSLTAKLIAISFHLSLWVPDAWVAQTAVQENNMPLRHVVPKGILLTSGVVMSLAEEKSQHREGETKFGYGSAKANGLNTSKRQELKRPTHTHVAACQPTLSLIFQLLQIVWSVGDHAEVISSPLCQSPIYMKYCKVEDATYICASVPRAQE